MSVDTKHPQITPEIERLWKIMRDTDDGDETVRKRGSLYLPIPGGFIAHWSQGGQEMWEAYLARAQFPEIVSPSINGMVGIIHRNEWQIELPPGMEFLFERATDDDLSLEAFSRRITRELLVMGRFSIAADASDRGGDPYLIGIRAENLINWDRDFAVVDETTTVRTGFDWETVEAFRIHQLDENGNYFQELVDSSGARIQDPAFPESTAGPLDFVPIVTAGARDVSRNVEIPPLIGAGKAALAAYRLDADYRHQLYMTGQETLVIDNGDAPSAIGPATVLELKSTQDAPASAFYVGPSGTGIEAHERGIKSERENAAAAGARLFDSSQEQESGEARRLRFGAESATLQTVANSAASALEMALKNVALMLGTDPNQVVVTPPRNLLDSRMTGQEAVQLVQAWQAGAFSYETLFDNLQRGQIASDERTPDEEMALIDQNNFTVGESDEL